MKLRGVLRLLTVMVTGTILVGVAGVQPASASQSFDFCTPFASEGGDGAACTSGEVTFWDRNSFLIGGKVNDACPGDGWEAASQIYIDFASGPNGYDVLASDGDGCTTAATSYVRTFHRDRNILRVKIQVCEMHFPDPLTIVCAHRFKDNPFTG